MPSITLAPYTIRFHRYRTTDALPLGSLDGGSDDAWDRLLDFFAGLERETDHHRESSSLLRLRKIDARSRRIEGLIETGEYGYTTTLVDVDVDHNRASYRRKTSEAELLPFYFLVELPRRADQGFVLLQRFGALGIKGAFERALTHFFRETAYRFELNPLVPDAVIRWWGGARQVRSLRLVRFELPKNVARAFQLGDRDEVYSELVIRARKGSTFPLPKRFTRRSDGGMVELQDLQSELDELRDELGGVFAPDDLKLEVDVDGRTRTIQARDPGKLAAYHDVTKAVEPLGEDGHPSWEKIRAAAHELLADLHRTVGSLQPSLVAAAGRRRGRGGVAPGEPEPTATAVDDRKAG